MESNGILFLLVYGILATAALAWLRNKPKHSIPVLVGSDNPLFYCVGAFKFFISALDTVAQGYFQNPNGVFRVPRLSRWDYLANGPQRVAELMAASDDVLSVYRGVADILQGDYTMGRELTDNPYHVNTVRGSLTRNIGRCFPDIYDEISCAIEDELGLRGPDWKEIRVLHTATQVVARTTARVFVGLPLCRNKAYTDLSIFYTTAVFWRSQILALLPNFLKPIFGRLFSARKSTIRRALKILGPTIEERIAKAELEKGHPDKPNDFISWVIDDTNEELSAPAIALRLLATNTAAIHTTSMALATALYDLTARPEYIAPMRAEAERVVREEGWTKGALSRMHKIDSFLCESQRMNGTAAVNLTRQVVSPAGFTFSDGTFIPPGAFIHVASRAVHLDSTNYDDPNVFDGFRFSREREQRHAKDVEVGDNAGLGVFRHYSVSTSPTYFVFGHGKHACPGRFFSVTELKTMLAYLLINYDMKALVEGVDGRPKDIMFGLYYRTPDPRGKILIRKREEAA